MNRTDLPGPGVARRGGLLIAALLILMAAVAVLTTALQATTQRDVTIADGAAAMVEHALLRHGERLAAEWVRTRSASASLHPERDDGGVGLIDDGIGWSTASTAVDGAADLPRIAWRLRISLFDACAVPPPQWLREGAWRTLAPVAAQAHLPMSALRDDAAIAAWIAALHDRNIPLLPAHPRRQGAAMTGFGSVPPPPPPGFAAPPGLLHWCSPEHAGMINVHTAPVAVLRVAAAAAGLEESVYERILEARRGGMLINEDQLAAGLRPTGGRSGYRSATTATPRLIARSRSWAARISLSRLDGEDAPPRERWVLLLGGSDSAMNVRVVRRHDLTPKATR